MSQIQGCPCPPPPIPGAFDNFYFLGSDSPPCGTFLWPNAPLSRDVLGVKCPAPRAEVTKPRLISGNLNEIFNTAISIFFLYTRTLQSSVSRQKQVQEHESVHSKFCNSRVFSEGSLPLGFNYWQRGKFFVKCT